MNLRRTCASLALVALAVASVPAVGEVLVRNCETPSATDCTRATWVPTAQASIVQVQRGGGAPWVSLSSVAPSERVAACYDDPGVQPGSTTVCAARVPGRSDLWQLKSVLYPAAPPPATKSIGLAIDASSPHWDSGAPLPANLLTDLTVRLYGAPEGQAATLLDSARWAAALNFRRESTSAERWCFAAALALDTTGDGTVDDESPPTASWCGTFADPAPVLHLAPPNGITGKSPAG